VVTVLFTPPGSATANAVVLTTADCSTLGKTLKQCGTQLGGGSASCVQVDPTMDPLALAIVDRNGQPRLSFRFPETDALLPPASDDRTFTGPATLAVTRQGDPLPCALAAASCASQTGLLACVDAFFTEDAACGVQPTQGSFGHFTALPPPNDFQADCF